MADQIDITNVQTMGQFRGAIEEYVQRQVSGAFYGVHGSLAISESLTSGLKEKEILNAEVKLPSNIGKHWGIINITTNNADTTIGREQVDRVFPQVQLIVWWENGRFKYSIAHNSLRFHERLGEASFKGMHYLQEDSVTFNENSNILGFTICGDQYVYGSSMGTTYAGKFKVDYHIW